MKAVTYIRVSTKSQGKSGLGVEAQRDLIGRFLSNHDGVLVQEYIDIVSGAKSDREILNKAIAHARKIGGTLVIAKLDRISRSVSFIASLMESGINFKIAEMPDATNFQLHIYAALAQEERRLISERTKAALQAAKARGIRLGTHGKTLAAHNRQTATQFAEMLKTQLLELRNEGSSFRLIAESFNQRGIKSYAGQGWHAASVRRACQRLQIV